VSAVSRLSIVLAALLVISAFFSSTPSPSARNASSSKPDTSATGHQDVLNAALVTPTQTGPYSEFSRRVKKFALNPRAAEIDFLCVEFERPYLGYEGPNFTELDGEPSAEAQYLATADLFGEAAISTAKFELVDQDGRVLQLLHFFKQDNSLENGRFFGSAKIPDLPFRIAVVEWASMVSRIGEFSNVSFDLLIGHPRRPSCRVISLHATRRESRLYC
jgi:hypothetical protein